MMVTTKYAVVGLLVAVAGGVVAGMVGAPAHASTPTRSSPTLESVVRPVHADGTAVRGWTVVDDTREHVDCTWSDGSPVRADADIQRCSPTADYAIACWASAKHTVLCLQDPLGHRLTRFTYDGRFRPAAAPTRQSPEEITLDNGMHCLVRDGGAWAWLDHRPGWTGFYSCGNEHYSVYGPISGDGIRRVTDPWQVTLVRDPGLPDESSSTHTVVHAYYAGTAR